MAGLLDAEIRAFAKNYSGSGNWLDESGNGHHGVISNALFYDHLGVNFWRSPGLNSNYVSCPDSAVNSGTGDFTASFLLSMDSITRADDAFAGKIDNTSNREWWFNFESGKLNLRVNDGAGGSADDDAFLSSTTLATEGIAVDEVFGMRIEYDNNNGSGQHAVTFKYKTGTLTAADIRSDTGWTTWGSTIVVSGTAARRNGTSRVSLGGGTFLGTWNPSTSNILFFEWRNNIAGAAAYEFEADDWTDLTTTYTDAVGSQVWTATRSGTAELGRVIDRAHFWFDTDAHIGMADHVDLDFAAGDALTIGVGFRSYDVNPSAYQVLLGKRNVTAEGYVLSLRGSGSSVFFVVEDTGGLGPNDDTPAFTDGGAHTAIGVRNITDDDVEAFGDGVGSGTPNTDTTTATLANSNPLRVGAESDGTNRFQGEVWSLAVVRQALSDAEVGTGVNTLHASLLNQVLPVPGGSGWGIPFAPR